MSENLSFINLISATHCRQRELELERKISKPDLQAAVRYGKGILSHICGKDGQQRWMFTYNGIVYITEHDKQTSVTCWAENQLPLEAAPLSKTQQTQVTEQKRRVSSGETKLTSHTVLIVDQSASMKNGDILGHRTRSRGVLYTIASEIIAAPLLHNLVNKTDFMSLIEMRTDAHIAPELENRPFTWEL